MFLPGLTADHHLFETQVSCFEDDFKVLVWDCPCHGKSRPYDEFTYANDCYELDCILEIEGISRAIFIGQSLGGMIAQYYIDQHPTKAIGFASIDSVPFGDYYSKSDLFWLTQLEWIGDMFPCAVGVDLFPCCVVIHGIASTHVEAVVLLSRS